MNKRPLCTALGAVVFLILLFRGYLEQERPEIYRGERKTVQCQIEEISGQEEAPVLTVCDVVEGDTELCRRMRILASAGKGNLTGLKIGNILTVTGEIHSFSHPGNPGQFDEYQYYRDQGISYLFFAETVTVRDSASKKLEQWLRDVRTVLCQRIMSCLPPEEGGVAAAMLLGEKGALSREIRSLYQENGISHILAISGLHISLIGAGIFFFLRSFIMPMRPAALVTGTLLVLYGQLTGFSISAQRAVWMMLCFLMAKFFGRRYDIYCALALSALIQLLIHPTVLFQAGFLLSYGTVLGIALFVRKFQQTDRRYPEICGVFLGSLGIQIVTAPILLYYYFELNPYSVFVNFLVLPLVSILLVMSAAGCLMTGFHQGAGRFLFGAVHFILLFYHRMGALARELPLACYITGRPEGWQILLYYLLLILWIVLHNRVKGKNGKTGHKLIRAGALPAAVLLLLFQIPEKKQLQITNLDVGQGDCTCIRLSGKTVLIDGGSSDVVEVGKYRISKYLKYYGIRRLDYIFITHSDSDHTSGIAEIIQDHNKMGFDIGALVLPDVKKRDENYKALEQLCHNCGITVKKMKKGDRIRVGGMDIRCIHPRRDYNWRTENDYSLVLSVKYGKFHGLFVGDLESAGEQEILWDIRDADYLKAGHHGSAGSSGEEFLAALRPEIAVISAGEDNRYGHPAPAALERLRKAGADIYSTIDSGAVTVDTDGAGIRVSTYK